MSNWGLRNQYHVPRELEQVSLVQGLSQNQQNYVISGACTHYLFERHIDIYIYIYLLSYS